MPPAFDDFAVLGPLGRGGMGHVYLARDVALDRSVAVKVIASETPSEGMRRRFLTEARALARLAHPNVVGVYRVGEVGGRPYVAYEFVAGQSLDRLQKPVPWTEALRIALGMARGLEAAHRGGILHRDIKPGNVMLSTSGDVKILDFGLAKLDADPSPPAGDDGPHPVSGEPVTLPASAAPTVSGGRLAAQATTVAADALTRPGVLMGTPLYLAPEQWRGELATAQSDLYALGLVLHELLAGALPHEGLAGEALMLAATSGDLPPIRMRCPDVPESFAQVVDRCVRREPAERFASAEELREALDGLSTVFLAATTSRPPARIDGDARVVALGFARVLPHLDTLTERLYARLFESRPALRALFPDDLAEQRAKLAHALRLSVEGLRDPDRLVPILEDLGRHHAPYGVTADHFGALGDALLRVLAELDAGAFGDEEAAAWRRAYDFISAAMLRGIDAEHGAGTRVSDEAAGTPPARERLSAPRPPATPRESGPIPRTRYALSAGDASVAYQVVGEGPLDLVFSMWAVSHVETTWQHPSLAGFVQRLARGARVVLFDKRGTGLSDNLPANAAFDDRLDDLAAVLDAADVVGARRAVLFGAAEAAWTCAAFAARHPDRVRALVLFGARARMFAAADDPEGALERAIDEIRRRWGEPLRIEHEAPSLAGDPEFRDWFARYLRTSASPGNAVALLRMNARFDLLPLLPAIRVPTLVLHRAGDCLAPAADGRLIAERIPGARHVELPGDDHVPFAGDTEAVHREIERFLADLR